MVEPNSDKSYSCKLCPEEATNNLGIANCIGCQDLFCVNHLIEHRQQLSTQIEQLTKRYLDINEKSLLQLDINQHSEYIDKWECETIEFIRRHTRCVKEKIISIFSKYKSELKQYHATLGKELDEKRELNTFIERDLMELSQRIEQLDKETQNVNKLLHQISIKELNEIINKYKLSTNSIEKSLNWNYSHQIKLDSTYGYMAANDHHIFLGWKNRIVIYNLDGTKHDETRLQSIDIFGELCDLTWSTTMQRFFILCRKSLFVHYPSSNQIQLLSNISLINQDNHYISLTTNENSLFLLHEKSLDIWKLRNEIFLLDYPISLAFLIANPSIESICCIRANENYLAILIQNTRTHTWRLDLFHIFPFRRIHIGHSIDRFNQPNLGLIMPFHNNIYLFMNWETKLTRLIDTNGANQIIDYNAYNACLLGTQRRLIVNYMTHLKVYEF